MRDSKQNIIPMLIQLSDLANDMSGTFCNMGTARTWERSNIIFYNLLLRTIKLKLKIGNWKLCKCFIENRLWGGLLDDVNVNLLLEIIEWRITKP